MTTFVYKGVPRAQVRTNGNTTIVVAGNSSVSNVAIGNENVLGASVSQIWFAVDGVVTIARGANTIVTLSNSTDHWDFREGGFSLSEYASANLVVTTAAAANCTLIIELTKQYF